MWESLIAMPGHGRAVESLSLLQGDFRLRVSSCERSRWWNRLQLYDRTILPVTRIGTRKQVAEQLSRGQRFTAPYQERYSMVTTIPRQEININVFPPLKQHLSFSSSSSTRSIHSFNSTIHTLSTNFYCLFRSNQHNPQTTNRQNAVLRHPRRRRRLRHWRRCQPAHRRLVHLSGPGRLRPQEHRRHRGCLRRLQGAPHRQRAVGHLPRLLPRRQGRRPRGLHLQLPRQAHRRRRVGGVLYPVRRRQRRCQLSAAIM